MPDFEIHLPAIRGIQAGRPFFIALCPTKFIPRLIPSGIARRTSRRSPFAAQPDRGRSQEICPIPRRQSGDLRPAGHHLPRGRRSAFRRSRLRRGQLSGLGTLRVPLSSRILILDGLNRRAGIEMALKLRPSWEMKRSRSCSTSTPGQVASSRCSPTFDETDRDPPAPRESSVTPRDETARITRELIARVDVFADMTETVRSTISNRSFKLFTLSGIYHATEILLSGRQKEPYADRLALAVDFWSEVSEADSRLATGQGARGKSSRLAEDLRPRPRDRSRRAREGRQIPYQGVSPILETAAPAPPVPGLGEVEYLALGRPGYDCRPALQDQRQRRAHGKCHQEAPGADLRS